MHDTYKICPQFYCTLHYAMIFEVIPSDDLSLSLPINATKKPFTKHTSIKTENILNISHIVLSLKREENKKLSAFILDVT